MFRSITAIKRETIIEPVSTQPLSPLSFIRLQDSTKAKLNLLMGISLTASKYALAAVGATIPFAIALLCSDELGEQTMMPSLSLSALGLGLFVKSQYGQKILGFFEREDIFHLLPVTVKEDEEQVRVKKKSPEHKVRFADVALIVEEDPSQTTLVAKQALFNSLTRLTGRAFVAKAVEVLDRQSHLLSEELVSLIIERMDVKMLPQVLRRLQVSNRITQTQQVLLESRITQNIAETEALKQQILLGRILGAKQTVQTRMAAEMRRIEEGRIEEQAKRLPYAMAAELRRAAEERLAAQAGQISDSTISPVVVGTIVEDGAQVPALVAPISKPKVEEQEARTELLKRLELLKGEDLYRAVMKLVATKSPLVTNGVVLYICNQLDARYLQEFADNMDILTADEQSIIRRRLAEFNVFQDQTTVSGQRAEIYKQLHELQGQALTSYIRELIRNHGKLLNEEYVTLILQRVDLADIKDVAMRFVPLTVKQQKIIDSRFSEHARLIVEQQHQDRVALAGVLVEAKGVALLAAINEALTNKRELLNDELISLILSVANMDSLPQITAKIETLSAGHLALIEERKTEMALAQQQAIAEEDLKKQEALEQERVKLIRNLETASGTVLYALINDTLKNQRQLLDDAVIQTILTIVGVDKLSNIAGKIGQLTAEQQAIIDQRVELERQRIETQNAEQERQRIKAELEASTKLAPEQIEKKTQAIINELGRFFNDFQRKSIDRINLEWAQLVEYAGSGNIKDIGIAMELVLKGETKLNFFQTLKEQLLDLDHWVWVAESLAPLTVAEQKIVDLGIKEYDIRHRLEQQQLFLTQLTTAHEDFDLAAIYILQQSPDNLSAEVMDLICAKMSLPALLPELEHLGKLTDSQQAMILSRVGEAEKEAQREELERERAELLTTLGAAAGDVFAIAVNDVVKNRPQLLNETIINLICLNVPLKYLRQVVAKLGTLTEQQQAIVAERLATKVTAQPVAQADLTKPVASAKAQTLLDLMYERNMDRAHPASISRDRKVFVIGDTYGSIRALQHNLRHIKAQGGSAGDHLLQIGDVLGDRVTQSLPSVVGMMKLHSAAESHGGTFNFLAGNHDDFVLSWLMGIPAAGEKADTALMNVAMGNQGSGILEFIKAFGTTEGIQAAEKIEAMPVNIMRQARMIELLQNQRNAVLESMRNGKVVDISGEKVNGRAILEFLYSSQLVQHVQDGLIFHTDPMLDMINFILKDGVDKLNAAYQEGLRAGLLGENKGVVKPHFFDLQKAFLFTNNRVENNILHSGIDQSQIANALRKAGYNFIIHGHTKTEPQLLAGYFPVISVDRNIGRNDKTEIPDDKHATSSLAELVAQYGDGFPQ